MAENWHLYRSKPGLDLLARRGLTEQGFRVYVPKSYRRETLGKRSFIVTELRLAPYAFVAFDVAKQQHGPISNTRGVQELFCNRDGRPRAVPASVVPSLRRIEDDEVEAASRRVRLVTQGIAPGTEVRIDRHDLFRGYVGMLISSVKGEALVATEGTVMIRLPECDLSVVEKAKRRA